MSLQLPTYTVHSVHSKNVSSQTTQHLITKGIASSAFQRLWQSGYTGKDIIVAVVDTGIDSNDTDLKGQVIKSINLTGEPLSESHGTHVAGTIAANGWLLGGAYDCKLLDIKVIGASGGTIPNIVQAIGLAAANGASVVNMSLGATNLSNSDIQSLTTAVQNAWNNGCICIAAAGNDGTSVCTPDVYEYPASIEKVESIAACIISDDLNGITLAPFSNENNRVSLGACGVNVFSTIIGNQYGIYSGTSMATPHVSAMCAVLAQYIKSKYPNLTGSNFSTNLVSLLHSNVLAIAACGGVTGTVAINLLGHPCPSSQSLSTQNGYNSALSGKVNIKYDNISFGLGFLRYEPTEGADVPNGTKYVANNIFVGYTVNR